MSTKTKISLRDKVCNELRNLQRFRSMNMKSRIMIENRLRATVAISLGYENVLSEAKREKMFKEADALIKRIQEGESHNLEGLVHSSHSGSEGYNQIIKNLEKQMIALVKKLKIKDWVEKPEQCGFGILSLAVILGETGNLENYETPGKLWSRMGCAPFESKGKMQMGATWKKAKPSLTANEWTEFGYCPRRRSIMYVISESLLKANKSVYRKRYDDAKENAAKNHPEWVECVCKGTGKSPKGSKCSNCMGKGRRMMRCHNHAMLLMGKLLLKNLWIEWNPDLASGYKWA